MDDKRRSRPAVPTNVSRLARALSTKGLKKSEPFAAHAPSLEMLIEESHPSLDPDKLINTFDSKLSLIQKMLREYQNEGKQRPDGEKRQKKIAAQAASVAGEAKGKNKQFTEEEAYMNEKIERRVRSAGAGASRALSERVHMYRTNAVARAELHERCLMHKKVKAEAEMKAVADRSHALDFIRSNRECLQGIAGLPILNEGNSTGLFTPCVSRRSSGAPLRPSTAPQVRGSPSTTLKTSRAHAGTPGATSDLLHTTPDLQLPLSVQPCEGSCPVEHTRWTDAMPLQQKEFRTPAFNTFLARGAANGSDEHDTDLPFEESTMQLEGQFNAQVDKVGAPSRAVSPSSNRSLVSFQRIFPPPQSPVPCPPLHPPLRLHGGSCQGLGLADSGAHQQGCAADTLQASQHTNHLRKLQHQEPGLGQQVAPPLSAARQASSWSGKPRPNNNILDEKDEQRPASSPYLGMQMPKLQAKSTFGANASHAASLGANSQHWSDGDGSRRSVIGPPHDSSLISTGAHVDESSVSAIDRELRLLLTSRPGGGGSPTKRTEFNIQYKVLAMKRERQLNEAKMRKEDLEWARLNQSEQEAKLKAEAEETEQRIKEHAQRKMELIHRHRTWLGTCSLASKLWYIADCVKKDREVHPMRELRRRAAATIADWYKALLDKRKSMQLVQLQFKLQKILAPYIAAKRAQVRQRCGERILHFCALNQKGAAESALIAVKRYRQRLVVIQRAWRTCLAVRAMQQMLLYNHLSKFEKFVLAKAQREAAVTEAAGRQHVRRTPTLLKAISSSQPKGDASVVPRRESSSGRKTRQTEVEDSVVEDALAKHLQPLSKEVKQQVVAEALRECRKKFHFQMMAFMHDKATYLAQKPIDDLRQALLRDAGLQAPHELTEPQHPVMLVLLPRAQLKGILFNGIQVESAKKAQYEAERRARAEAAWIELQGSREKPRAAARKKYG
mmetsp:Transcript_11795/g.32137  ORF Transcript_11795/g.32137 Transcript_11795/m.32137 type:complete len:954 (+) Transcript_11795:177-3038(+)